MDGLSTQTIRLLGRSFIDRANQKSSGSPARNSGDF
jgi:hypothetical protein